MNEQKSVKSETLLEDTARVIEPAGEMSDQEELTNHPYSHLCARNVFKRENNEFEGAMRETEAMTDGN